MSADNGIYILKTTSMWQKNNGYNFSDGSTRPVWRVAHVIAIDNLAWYSKNQPYNLGAFMYSHWKDSEVFYKEEEAQEAARELLKTETEHFGIVEYGIQIIDMEN